GHAEGGNAGARTRRAPRRDGRRAAERPAGAREGPQAEPEGVRSTDAGRTAPCVNGTPPGRSFGRRVRSSVNQSGILPHSPPAPWTEHDWKMYEAALAVPEEADDRR